MGDSVPSSSLNFSNHATPKTTKAFFAVHNAASADTVNKIRAGSLNASDHPTVAVDLITLASVRTAAKDVASSSIPRIRALVLNAALQHTQSIQHTEDGLEATLSIIFPNSCSPSCYRRACTR